MNRRERWMDRLLTGAGLMEENPGKFPLVELCADHRVLVENHMGVLQYSTEGITVAVGFGQLRIQGEGLCMSQMSPEKLVIRGKIHGIELCRREK